MTKWFSSKEAKKITGIILILCTALIVQIIGFLHFNEKLYDMSLDHSMQQVKELSIYIENNLRLELERYIQILELAQSELEKEQSLFCPKMIRHLEKVHQIAGFQMMGISDLDGNGVDSAGNTYNISYEHIREDILNDKIYISNVLKNDNDTLIFIAVPLKIKGKICGILWAKHALADIVENIEFSSDMYKYFQIIDDKGNYLLSSNSKFVLNPNENVPEQTLWEELTSYHYSNGMSPQKIQEMVSRGESGSFYFRGDQQRRYVNFRPLKINNWYLFSVQVEDGLHAYVDHTRKLAIQFFIVLTICLLSIFGTIYNLIYTMYKKIAKQMHEIQTINTMFQITLQQTKNIPFTIDHKLKQIVLYGYPTKDITQCCSFEDISPENMLKKGLLDAGSLEDYQKLYQSLFVEQKKCDPVIIYSRLGERQEWLRISIASETQDNAEQMIGVLENYGEQKEKEQQIENHLDDIRKIEEKSQIDFLTGLYNREAFLEKINAAFEASLHDQSANALLILDLDHFKEVNDRMGHGMGDVVLQKTANTLHSFFRKDDIVARLGGDEFVVFAQNIRSIPAFEQRIKDLNRLLCKIYYKDGRSVEVSASIGIALTDAAHFTFESLYERADQALYRVKNANKNGYHIYSETDNRTAEV